MLDAPPRRVSARPNPPAPPASAQGDKPARLLAAARSLLNVLSGGRGLTASVLRDAMTAAFGGSDAEGAWVWKDAYDAAEAAVVLFVKRFGTAMRREAGPGPGGPAAMLDMLARLAALNRPTPAGRRNRSACSNSPRPCRWPTSRAGRRDPARRPGAGAVRRHGIPRGHGVLRATRHGHQEPSPQRTGSDSGGTPDKALSRRVREPAQRRVHRRPPARIRALGRAHESSVLRQPGGTAPPSGRGPAPYPLGILHAAAGRAAGGHHVALLRARQTGVAVGVPASGPTGESRVFHGHRRPRLCPPRHVVRYPSDGAGPPSSDERRRR